MSMLRVTPGQLESLGTAVARQSVEMRAQQQRLRAQLQPLFGVEWAGTAATRFQSLYTDFDHHAHGLTDALEGLGQLLGRAGLAYADVESRIAASFR